MPKNLKVLVTGGAGYIGSTIASALEDEAGSQDAAVHELLEGLPATWA